MKIAIAGGHSKKAPGAVGYLNEYECDRAFVRELIPRLRARGHTVIDCSNEKGDQNSELKEEVRLANESHADLFIAVHLNAGGGTGTECYTYPNTSFQLAEDVAKRMSANVAAALGLPDRGAKSANFYVLKWTNMAAVLLEVCFVDRREDKAAWDSTSWDELCDAVIRGIEGEQSGGQWVQDATGWWWRNPDGSYPSNTWELINGDWYWFDGSGYAVADCCLNINGEWFAFGRDCRMKWEVRTDSRGVLKL